MRWLSTDELLLIHERVLQETTGAAGIIIHSGLESALARPFASFDGEELYPDLVGKVATFIHALITSHPFVDGNKRVVLVAGDVCLRLNGFRLVPLDDIEPFFWSVARGEHSVESIQDWLNRHIEPLNQR